MQELQLKSSSLPRFEGEFDYKLAKKQPWYKFKKQKIILKKPFIYWWKGTIPIRVHQDFQSDGFSIPIILQIASLNQFSSFMDGLQASVLHDFLCEKNMFTREQRVEIFDEATEILELNATNRAMIVCGARIGSFFGYC
jgi:hypothetical protein